MKHLQVSKKKGKKKKFHKIRKAQAQPGNK